MADENTNTVPKLFVFTVFLPLVVASSCTTECEWAQWEGWSRDCQCGIAYQTRYRERALCCDVDIDTHQCIENCGHSTEGFIDSNECQPTCYNGGDMIATGCRCSGRYYGSCCETRVNTCEAVPADVVFVLDSSLSQTEEEFNKQLDFVARFIDAVNVSDTAFQFAVVTFSTEAALEIDFDSALAKQELKTHVLNIKFRPGATFTNKGLDKARTLLAQRQNRLAGLSIVKFAFVLTDGMSSNRHATEAAARNLRADTFVVAIGIGSEVSHKELRTIASPPDAYSLFYVYSVENFDALNTLIDRLIDATCEQCAVSNMTDIVVIIDDLSDSAMNGEEFRIALNSLTHVVQHLSAYGQPDGQKVVISIVGDHESKRLQMSNTSDLNTLLFTIQRIRQRAFTCDNDKCAAEMPTNITSAIKETINTFDQVLEGRSGARKLVLVFSSGRFESKSAIKSELRQLNNDSAIHVYAIGSGYDANMEGLQAIVKEPSNVFLLLDDDLETLNMLQSKMTYIKCS